ncbi:MAG: hypothetical protein JXQ76_12425 [Campylobacterales bacterium]|nr:hypothetical protein [Campylobacterales bacterium]
MEFISKYLFHIAIASVVALGGLSMKINLELSRMATLKSNLAQLKKQNKELQNKNKALHQKNKKVALKYQEHKAKRNQQLLARAKQKIATAPAKAVPLLGVAAIITTTAADVNDFCNDIKQMDTLEKELFDSVSPNNLSSEIHSICSLDIQKYLTHILENDS